MTPVYEQLRKHRRQIISGFTTLRDVQESKSLLKHHGINIKNITLQKVIYVTSYN